MCGSDVAIDRPNHNTTECSLLSPDYNSVSSSDYATDGMQKLFILSIFKCVYIKLIN